MSWQKVKVLTSKQNATELLFHLDIVYFSIFYIICIRMDLPPCPDFLCLGQNRFGIPFWDR